MTESEVATATLTRVPQFPTQMWGYARHEVDQYVATLRKEARQLSADLCKAREEAQRQPQNTLIEADRVQVTHILPPDPGDEGARLRIADHLQQIMLLVEEEVERRSAEITRRSAEIVAAREQADQEVEQLLAAARREAASVIADAEQQAEQDVAAARAEADRLVREAREQAGDVNSRLAAQVAHLGRLHEEARLALHRLPGPVRTDEETDEPYGVPAPTEELDGWAQTAH